ncbi:MAG: hypothetical protein E7610_09235 [Ruminococcaceae bacterium]|nr:hypothetical protein [Oscillospiraceae bacterium]
MNQESHNFEEMSRQAREANRRLKKRMVIVLACLMAFAVVAIPLISYLDSLEKKENEEKETKKESTIIFYEADWDLNIMEEPGYLAMDRTVYYCDEQYGITEALDDKNRAEFGPAVAVLCEMIERIIAGDADGYNDLFSSNYYENNDPEPPFTMQQVYDIKLTKVKEMQTSQGYTQYEFDVEYRIRHNNGTFRTDIDEGESRKQYFVLSDSTSKKVLIDQILGYNYQG